MNTPANQSLVSIGIPTYNRPDGLRKTLECMANQSYANLEIIVSDNCSPGDETRKAVEQFMKNDNRIQYYRQEENKGPVFNFKFVLEKSTGQYFMWASDDDLWENNFIETGVRTLTENTFYQAWFCAIDNIDSLNRAIKIYERFSEYTSLKNKKKEIFRYLEEPGLSGKPNIIYSLFKTDAVKETANQYFFSDNYASDIAFNLAFLARYNLIATDEILFHKRVFRKHIVDTPDKIIPLVSKRPNRTITPKRAIKYFYECYKATRSTKYKRTAIFAMILQIPRIIISGILDKIDSIKRCISKCFYQNEH